MLRTLSASFLYIFLAYIYPAYILLFVLTLFLFPIVFLLFKDSDVFFYCILYLFSFIRTLSSRSYSFVHGVFREEPCPFAVHQIQSWRLSFESHSAITLWPYSAFLRFHFYTCTHTRHHHTGNSNFWDCLCPLLFAFKSYWFHKIVFGFFLASPCLHYFDGPFNSSHTLLLLPFYSHLFFYSHSVWFVESRPFFFFFFALGSSGGSAVKNLPAMQEPQEMQVQSLGWEVNHGNALQYFCLKNPMDRGA